MTFQEPRAAAGPTHVHALSDALAELSLTDRLRAVRNAIDGRFVFTTSFGLEDQALTHAVVESGIEAEIVTLDTGRLFERRSSSGPRPSSATASRSGQSRPMGRNWRN
jgi:3'-phosphoadenosine 5'-phosphosulfate sulfotransferase (PAPS reductase)/FAD synthetase